MHTYSIDFIKKGIIIILYFAETKDWYTDLHIECKLNLMSTKKYIKYTHNNEEDTYNTI